MVWHRRPILRYWWYKWGEKEKGFLPAPSRCSGLRVTELTADLDSRFRENDK